MNLDRNLLLVLGSRDSIVGVMTILRPAQLRNLYLLTYLFYRDESFLGS